jgi:hypothetical protein
VARGLNRLMVAHNHPSGVAQPSEADKGVTFKLLQAAKLLDLEVIDHIVVGQGGYVSMRQSVRQLWREAGFNSVVSNGWIAYDYDNQANLDLPEREGGETEGLEGAEVTADELDGIEAMLIGMVGNDEVCGFSDESAGTEEGQNETA